MTDKVKQYRERTKKCRHCIHYSYDGNGNEIAWCNAKSKCMKIYKASPFCTCFEVKE